MRTERAISLALASVLAGTFVSAQVGRGGAEWLTSLGDAQRTSWIRSDAKISLETMSKPGFELQWKRKLDNQPRQLNGLSAGVSANGVTLFVPMSVVTGSSNNVYALDNDTGYVVWQRKFDAPLPAATAACPGGITSAATRIVSLTPTPLPAGRGGGRGQTGYRTVLGEPSQGVPVEARGGGPGRGPGAPPAGAPGAAPGAARGAAPGAPAGGAPPAGGVAAPGTPPPPGNPQPTPPPQQQGRGLQPIGIPGAPPAPPAGGLGRPSGVVYVIASDGALHVMGLPSGKDMQKPAEFLPSNARWTDAVAVNTTLYAATSGNCGNAPNGVWAIDLDSEAKNVVSWKNTGGGVVGAIALTSDGTIIAAVGPGQATGDGKSNAIVALDPKTLALKDWYTDPSAEFVTGPSILRTEGKEIVAAATKDGRVLLLDASSLGGGNHSTALHASKPVIGTGGSIASSALAMWQEGATVAPAAAPGAAPAPAPEPNGTRWVLVPVSGRLAAGAQPTNGAVTNGGVIALKVSGSGTSLSLEPGWVSHDLSAPATPIVVNGVVFALSTGRPAAAGGRGTPAVLRAYDGASGKALWSSDKAMTTFASPGSFWSAMGQTYVGTNDGTIYAFGFLDERR